MNVAFLGPSSSPIFAYLRSIEDQVIPGDDPVAAILGRVEFVVSHNYKHIVPPGVCEAFGPTIINCHTSFLPWNRGSQPNFWSWVDDTPKGVSIHQITARLDAGPIYAQTQVNFLRPETETLATTHAYLQEQMTSLFKEVWASIKRGELKPVPQEPGGSYHSRADFAAVKDQYLTNGWDTPVLALKQGKA